MSEEQEDALFEYIGKVKNLGEYLARGNTVSTEDYEVYSVDREAIITEGAFSIENIDMRDHLEREYYGEIRSISAMMELINDGDYVPSEEFDEDMDEKGLEKDDVKIYKAIKRRLTQLLKEIMIKLYMGLKVPVNKEDVKAMKIFTMQQRGEDDDGIYEEPYPNEDKDGREIYEEDEDKSKEKLYLVYNQGTKTFNVINDEGGLEETDIDVSTAMPEVMYYLYKIEMEKRYAKLTTGKMDIKPTYTGIIVGDGHDER